MSLDQNYLHKEIYKTFWKYDRNPYYIFAPEYVEHSSGCLVLHFLWHRSLRHLHIQFLQPSLLFGQEIGKWFQFRNKDHKQDFPG
jgi:hypothetical protein